MKTQSLLAITVAFAVATLLPPCLPGVAEAQDAPAAGTDRDSVIDLSALTPEQLAELLARAAAARLRIERDVVASEIRGDLLYEEPGVGEALKLLQENPANTQDDNMGRICRAFAKVDDDFGEGYKLFTAGKHDQALKKMKAILDPQKSTYLSAASHYVYAETLFNLGSYDDAVDAYGTILTIMPDRLSFAAASASKCAQAYEKTNRFYYAAQVYVHCLQNYGLTISEDELERIAERLEYLQDIYKDPIKAVADRMGQVRSRLEELDSGDKTREKQKEIVAILEDLIKTVEENQKRGGSSQSRQQSPKQEQKAKSRQALAEAMAKAGRAQGQPTSPAQTGYLRGGLAEKPENLAQVRPTAGADDWAKLSPRERQEIERAMQRLLPERYRQKIVDYRKQLSKGGAGSEE